jgi:hypothetical protein
MGSCHPAKARKYSAGSGRQESQPENNARRGIAMTERKFFKSAGVITAFAAIVFAGMVTSSRQVKAHDDDDDERDEAKVRRGFEIAPVPLDLVGKNRHLVGLGSYIVNAQGDCNGCHSAGPATEFAPGGNPYFGQKPTVVNPKTYLGGGRDFGPFPAAGLFPHIISRNLTPDKSGRPEGGNTFTTFKAIIRTGIDVDKVHPTCTGKPDGTCLPLPFDGSLLQIMPWPIYANMTDHDLHAIYEYLSAIPCLEGGPGEPANRCQ